MIDIIDAPFPYIIGLDPQAPIEDYDIQQEVTLVHLDFGQVTTPTDTLMQSNMPRLPFREHKILKQRLMKATVNIQPISDKQMLE